PGARFIKKIDGFYGPESVKYDPDQDVWFVSNMLGYGSAKDGAGYIVRIPAASLGPPTIFITSGRNGAVLDAPKGMAIHGDTLWVADIDVLRGFDRRTGARLATVDFRPQHAQLLNDVTVGHDGRLYVTDSGIAMTEDGVLHPGGDRVFAVGPGGAISVVAAGPSLGRPNGIIPDPSGNGLVVVSFDPFKSLAYRLNPGDPRATLTPLGEGKGKFDGVEPASGGRLLVAAWNDSSIHLIGGGKDEKIIRGLWQPADIGVDTRRNRIAIPQPVRDRVEFWELPRR
ncbi:MAG TPA: SMP-30/gluconolactonase/LRE family protein, partial [Longimicrobiaceae bacterium]|nr:SMP-30/gluconolactonase/LRE family protein [Longimicrobiaceae bacterium]